MTDRVDEFIRQSLRIEDEELLKDLPEAGITGRLFTALRRMPLWARWFVLAGGIVLHIVMIWFIIRFFNATETQEMIAWATGFLLITIFIVAMKIWVWMQMEKYVILRELKRLELQIARLAEREGS
ncbi:MAG: hypothetical protein EA376_03365 [Phycisphaeraceae bacterium]|nr:MAG: hypothetical protein EA376_03365 [Phycisphaeraceae bacterium]